MKVEEVIVSEVEKESNREITWYLLGALGDGTLYHDNGRYVIEYGQKCVVWLKLAVGSRFERLGYKPMILRHGSKYWRLKVYSKNLYEEFKHLRGKVPELEHFVKFCKGFFDAEGSIIRQDAKRVCVRLSQKNYSMLEDVRRNLVKLGIRTTSVFPSDRKGVYVVQVPYHSLKLFVRLIGTNHPLKFEKLYMLGLI